TLGRTDEAEAVARDVSRDAPEDDLVPQVLWRATLGRVLARRGRLDQARPLAAEALRLTNDVEFPDLRVAALGAAADVAEAEGRRDDARRGLETARAIMAAKENVAAVAILDAELSRRLPLLPQKE
ncbi:MAG TPA: tetratricopeptide repeat protein, partial [Gaiellaceae bacterium]|nr:tetratricopeptide repeat protein [Gaiellaceae bacterium]